MSDAVQQMIERLERPGLRIRTGVITVPAKRMEQVENIAVALNAAQEDVAERLRRSLPEGTRFANLDAPRVCKLLDEISNQQQGHIRALVVNLDLLLSALDATAREQVWHHFFFNMVYRPRVLLALVPVEARNLLPSGDDYLQIARIANLE